MTATSTAVYILAVIGGLCLACTATIVLGAIGCSVQTCLARRRNARRLVVEAEAELQRVAGK